MKIDLQLFGGRGGGSGMSQAKTTPKGYSYGGRGSEISPDANPVRVDRVNGWLSSYGYTLDEAISQVHDAISDFEDSDPYTADFLKDMLPSMVDATINRRDLREVAATALY